MIQIIHVRPKIWSHEPVRVNLRLEGHGVTCTMVSLDICVVDTILLDNCSLVTTATDGWCHKIALTDMWDPLRVPYG